MEVLSADSARPAFTFIGLSLGEESNCCGTGEEDGIVEQPSAGVAGFYGRMASTLFGPAGGEDSKPPLVYTQTTVSVIGPRRGSTSSVISSSNDAAVVPKTESSDTESDDDKIVDEKRISTDDRPYLGQEMTRFANDGEREIAFRKMRGNSWKMGRIIPAAFISGLGIAAMRESFSHLIL